MDPVPKTSISGYEVLGNNPLMFVDPMGNDKKRVDTKNDFGGNSAWEVDEKGNAVGLGMSRAQQNVIVKGKDKRPFNNAFFGFNKTTRRESNEFMKGLTVYKVGRDNGYDVGKVPGINPENVKSFERWYQAEEDSRKMQLWVAGIITAPLAIYTVAESGAIYYGGQAGSYLVRRYGADFLTNTYKKVLENGGDVSKIDWFDVSFLTINPLKKFGVWGTAGTEIINSVFDYKFNQNGTGKLQIAFLTKPDNSFIIDLQSGLLKTAMKSTFNELGGSNTNRDLGIDVGFGNLKRTVKDAVGN